MHVLLRACGQGRIAIFLSAAHVVRSQIIPAHVITFLGCILVQYCTASLVLRVIKTATPCLGLVNTCAKRFNFLSE